MRGESVIRDFWSWLKPIMEKTFGERHVLAMAILIMWTRLRTSPVAHNRLTILEPKAHILGVPNSCTYKLIMSLNTTSLIEILKLLSTPTSRCKLLKNLLCRLSPEKFSLAKCSTKILAYPLRKLSLLLTDL